MRNAFRIVVGNLDWKDNLEDLDADFRITFKCISKTGYQVVDKIRLAQDSDRWGALVNTVMKLLV
jgi:hypothetical protein